MQIKRTNRRSRRRGLGCGTIFCVAIGLGLPGIVKASVYNVTTTNPSGTGSLSLALQQAQGDSSAIVNINSGLGTITLTGPLPEIQNNLILQAQTNSLSGGVSTNWVDVPGSTLVHSMTFPTSTSNCVFFRLRLP